jgi:two-component system chemotaxis sensor kinase CheA
MDFVGMLCDETEAGNDHGAQHADAAVGLAAALRALKGDDVAAAGHDDAGRVHAAKDKRAPASVVAPAGPALLPAAAKRIPVAVLDEAMQDLLAGASLRFITYRPSEACFYQGDDPLLRAMQTPGAIWGDIGARTSWPDLSALDAFSCVLDFHVLSDAPLAEIEEHFRYVPDERQIVALDPRMWAVAVTAPTQGSPAKLSAAADALAGIIRSQRDILALADGNAPGFPGRTRAVAGVLAACLAALGRSGEVPELHAAAESAIAAVQAGPLAAWLDTALPPGSFALGDESGESGTLDGQPTPGTAERQTPAMAWGPLTDTNAPRAIAPAALAEGTAAPDADAVPNADRRGEDARAGKSLKVDAQKIDRLMNLIGEMVVAKNAIPFLASRAETVYEARELSREIKAQYAIINRISDEMQDAILQVRMLPVSFIFQRFPRLVRDTSRRLGKEVHLVLEGQDTAADKNIIESLGDPLVHILRNSLDHGFESAEERQRAGKPRAGTLKICARQEADRVIIEISDDGKGIDPEVVKRKAYEKGLIDEQALERLSDQEAIMLVFLPGFSTAELVSDLSGRGVGMDVVRTAINRVNGSIDLESRKGHGTRIRLSLPLSMAVTSVMMIESDGQRFGVPMDAVIETVRVARSDVRTIKGGMVTVLRDRVIPLTSLNSVLGLAAPPLANEDDKLAVLVVRILDETVGLLVDDFHEAVSTILKPLAGVLGQLAAYAGSALMGDGTVLMVINLKELL